MEGSDKVRGAIIEGGGARDVSQEVLAYKFFLGAPDFPSLFVEDGVLVRVDLSLISTRQRSEEMRKKGEVDVVFVVEGGRRLYSGGGDGRQVAERWGWAPNNIFRRRGACWEDSRDGQRDVLDFFEEGEVGNEHIKIRSVGGDVGKEVQ